MSEQATDFGRQIGKIMLLMSAVIVAAMVAGAGLFAGMLALLRGIG